MSHVTVVATIQAKPDHIDAVRDEVRIAVAEHAMALILSLAKRICLTHGRLDVASLEQVGFPARMYDRRHVAGANWSRVDGLMTLSGTTFGALGLGEIGRGQRSDFLRRHDGRNVNEIDPGKFWQSERHISPTPSA